MKKLKPWKKVKITGYKRTSGSRGDPRKSILIVCEGARTEPNYFNAFKCKSARVDIDPAGANTLALVRRAVKLKKDAESFGQAYDQIWCVFDKDDFPLKNVRAAFKLAQQNEIQVAYSHESFELWYILHFNYIASAITRKDYIKKLTRLLGFDYKKDDPQMYQLLLEKQSKAIQHAKKLMTTHSEDIHHAEKAPSTTVHILVEELNRNL